MASTALITPYQSLTDFVKVYPLVNHSSRVFNIVEPTFPNPPTTVTIGLSVSDAVIEDIGSIDASVSDAVIQDVTPSSGSPNISLSASSLSFTQTNVGSTSDMTLTISNTGTADLVISSITPNGDFTVVGVN